MTSVFSYYIFNSFVNSLYTELEYHIFMIFQEVKKIPDKLSGTKCSRRESNPHCRSRSPVFYPLDYGCKIYHCNEQKLYYHIHRQNAKPFFHSIEKWEEFFLGTRLLADKIKFSHFSSV